MAEKLALLIGKPVPALSDCVGAEVQSAIDALSPGQVVMLENLRFHVGEEENSPAFASLLARPFDFVVNDAFGVAHREHASTVGIAQVLPIYAGDLMTREVRTLTNVLENPRRPFYVLVGGKKITDKLSALSRLLAVADGFLVGGGACFPLLSQRGIAIPAGIIDTDVAPYVTKFVASASSLKRPIWLPSDFVVTHQRSASAIVDTCAVNAIPDGYQALDIGSKTINEFGSVLNNAGTIVWAGPMGVFENPAFANGTKEIAKCLANSNADTIVGGGETAEAVIRFGFEKAFSHISTGGGATLAFIESGSLPALKPLLD